MIYNFSNQVSMSVLLNSFFQYLEKVPHWRTGCENLLIPDTVQELESSIHQHQSLIENVAQAYTEVRYIY